LIKVTKKQIQLKKRTPFVVFFFLPLSILRESLFLPKSKPHFEFIQEPFQADFNLRTGDSATEDYQFYPQSAFRVLSER